MFIYVRLHSNVIKIYLGVWRNVLLFKKRINSNGLRDRLFKRGQAPKGARASFLRARYVVCKNINTYLLPFRTDNNDRNFK